MLHQLWIRVLIAHHGGAHLLQGKPQWLLAGCQVVNVSLAFPASWL
jgi:type IV secretory pathway VirB2 component (pilin)